MLNNRISIIFKEEVFQKSPINCMSTKGNNVSMCVSFLQKQVSRKGLQNNVKHGSFTSIMDHVLSAK